MQILPVNLDAFLIELPDLDSTMALYRSLQVARLPGVAELLPAARTVLVRLTPGTDPAALITAILQLDQTPPPRTDARLVEIPVLYDGPDLAWVAETLGIPPAEVIARHAAADYRVAFTGFAPGFAYLTATGAGLDVPRRQTPRTRIPAGAVGLAGTFSGVYPRESPGGWQIIGVTPATMFDPDRQPTALLAPGDRVRFRAIDRLPEPAPPRSAAAAPAEPGLTLLDARLPVLVQDMGRPGQAGIGVPVSGALDRAALARANALMGNPEAVPGLEITLGAASFLAEVAMTVVLTGAPCELVLTTAEGQVMTAPMDRALHLRPGDRLQLEAPARGMRSYLAVAGGFALTPTLGSAATDTLSGLGPAPLVAGSRLALANQPTGAPRAVPAPPALPGPEDIVVLDVVMGPRTQMFTPEAVTLFTRQSWLVIPASSRTGIRLSGAQPLNRKDSAELPSEGTLRGAIQVPAAGHPVLFLSDHPVTGGYPVIASVAPWHLDLAGQIPPGAQLRFRPHAPFQRLDPECP